MKAGKSLERLVEFLEKTLANSEGVQIESPKKMRDRLTGRLREHDVVITIKEYHHELTIAIECRDRSRPMTVNQVEGFWKKCQDTGVNKAVIVSAKGFWNTARKKAEMLGIRCIDLEQATSFDWMLETGLKISKTHIDHVHWTAFPVQSGVKPTDFSLVDQEGNEIDFKVLNANAQQKLNAVLVEAAQADPVQHLAMMSDPLPKQSIFVFDGEGVFLRDNQNGQLFPLKSLRARIEYHVTQESETPRLFRYVDKNVDFCIAEAAVTPLNLGNIRGNLVIMMKDDRTGAVGFLPDQDSTKQA